MPITVEKGAVSRAMARALGAKKAPAAPPPAKPFDPTDDMPWFLRAENRERVIAETRAKKAAQKG